MMGMTPSQQNSPSSPPALALLERLRIPYRVIEHEAVMTVQESMDKGVMAELDSEDHHVLKNLLLQTKRGKLYLLVARGEQRVDLKDLASQLGSARLSFARPEVVEEAFGSRPGAISLFDLIDAPAPVTLVLDGGILELTGTTGFHIGTNTSTVVLAVSDLPQVAEAVQPGAIVTGSR